MKTKIKITKVNSLSDNELIKKYESGKIDMKKVLEVTIKKTK
jgi:hypothetical protein